MIPKEPITRGGGIPFGNKCRAWLSKLRAIALPVQYHTATAAQLQPQPVYFNHPLLLHPGSVQTTPNCREPGSIGTGKGWRCTTEVIANHGILPFYPCSLCKMWCYFYRKIIYIYAFVSQIKPFPSQTVLTMSNAAMWSTARTRAHNGTHLLQQRKERESQGAQHVFYSISHMQNKGLRLQCWAWK